MAVGDSAAVERLQRINQEGTAACLCEAALAYLIDRLEGAGYANSQVLRDAAEGAAEMAEPF